MYLAWAELGKISVPVGGWVGEMQKKTMKIVMLVKLPASERSMSKINQI